MSWFILCPSVHLFRTKLRGIGSMDREDREPRCNWTYDTFRQISFWRYLQKDNLTPSSLPFPLPFLKSRFFVFTLLITFRKGKFAQILDVHLFDTETIGIEKRWKDCLWRGWRQRGFFLCLILSFVSFDILLLFTILTFKFPDN